MCVCARVDLAEEDTDSLECVCACVCVCVCVCVFDLAEEGAPVVSE